MTESAHFVISTEVSEANEVEKSHNKGGDSSTALGMTEKQGLKKSRRCFDKLNMTYFEMARRGFRHRALLPLIGEVLERSERKRVSETPLSLASS